MTIKIVDVREPVEFESSHVVGAINIPLSGIMNGQANLDVIGKDEELILYCNSGNRSGIGEQILKNKGFRNIVNGINQHTVELKHL